MQFTESIHSRGPDELEAFVDTVFASLPRSDQRRWAEVYLRGLISCEAKKTVKNISEAILRRPADESLRQFINRSSWEWSPVRAVLAGSAVRELGPSVVVARRVIFPKHGMQSVGVARRFVAETGRTLNCQIGTGLFLGSSRAAVAADWRLVLTERWQRHESPGAHADAPTSVRAGWEHVLDMVDGLIEQGVAEGLPVAVDAEGPAEAAALAEALDARDVTFAVRVGRGPAWPPEPDTRWVTNLRRGGLDVVRDGEYRVQEALAAMVDDFGLRDFEGRSLRGWHHHTTLVSAAHAFARQGSRAREVRRHARSA